MSAPYEECVDDKTYVHYLQYAIQYKILHMPHDQFHLLKSIQHAICSSYQSYTVVLVYNFTTHHWQAFTRRKHCPHVKEIYSAYAKQMHMLWWPHIFVIKQSSFSVFFNVHSRKRQIPIDDYQVWNTCVELAENVSKCVLRQ